MSTSYYGEGGNIVIVSSVAASAGLARPVPWITRYKGAIDTSSVGQRGCGRRGYVNAVRPGIIDNTENQTPQAARPTGASDPRRRCPCSALARLQK
jgi:NAD(P)-dependent dehydrogenase (short-subunit alcohol dehydrogenase family)